MKRKNLKKAGAFLLAAAMLLTGIPKFSTEARATGAELPDTSQFATIEQLKAFNTNDNDGEVNPAKVKFGQNGSGSAQEWWIVGSQNNNSIVLFSASSLTNSFFSYNTNNKTYNDNGTDREVYANHYALSDVRSTLQNLVINTALILSILLYTFFSRMFDLCCLLQRSIVLLPLNHRRQSAVSRTDPPVIPIADEVSPDESF